MTSSTKIKGTKILSYNEEYKHDSIKNAAEIIKRGGLVAFPTETVYGLGAGVYNDSAIKRIYDVKGRPFDNPLIVHISEVSHLKPMVSHIPGEVNLLAKKFWPGPLTIVFKREHGFPAIISAGLQTVAVRIPSHPAALDLIRASGTPLAAPSANISGRPSPTEASHVIEDLAGKIDAILDGGGCQVGIESTVLDLTGETPVLLRPGGVSLEELEKCLERFVLIPNEEVMEKPLSPGMKYRHYAPQSELIIFRGLPEETIKKMISYCKQMTDRGKKVGVLSTMENRGFFPGAFVELLGKRDNLQEIAVSFFRALRNFDRLEVDVILGESFREEGIGMALMNRLKKAADRIIDV